MERNKDEVVEVLNRIVELELAGAVRYTQYSMMVFGHARIPIVGWMREKAAEALLHATEAGDEVTAFGAAVSLTIGELVSAHTQSVDDMMKDMPFDEMMQAMVPTYQKHFTKGDLDALVVFYTSPTGQKLLREMPAITAESMTAIMPIMRQHMDAMSRRLQQETDEMLKKP